MNYLDIPDSNSKLVDGNVVMLERFPGLKWIVHDGWYRYHGRDYKGWYFVSIPSQTILPVSTEDLRMITIVSSKYNDADPDYPAPPTPHPHHHDDDHHHHHHHPDDPGGLWPPVPPPPEPERPALFTRALKKQLDEAFISVPTLKKRDELDTTMMPDGKIIRVNSVDGLPKYYAWSAFNDHYEELNFATSEDIDEKLSHYYTSEQVDAYLSDVNGRIDDVSTALDEATQALQHNIDEVDVKVDDLATSTSERFDEVRQDINTIEQEIEDIRQEIAEREDYEDEKISEIEERLHRLEEAVFNIQYIAELLTSNTVLVSQDGGIKDSGVNIGDDIIEEPSEYANQKTLATEKAVVNKVEEASLKWGTF